MIKKILKWTGLLFFSILIVGGSFAAHEWYAEKPFVFRLYLDRTALQLVLDRPETLTSLGFLEAVGIDSHNAELNDDSPEKEDEMFAQIKQVKVTIDSYKDEDLSKSDQLSKEIALYLLETGIESEAFRYHDYPVNQLFGLQSDLPSFMDAMHQVNTVGDAEHYISRLSKFYLKFKQNIKGLKIREQKGIIPPRFVIERVLDEMRNFVIQPMEQNILYDSFKNKLLKVEGISITEQTRLLASVMAQMNASVYPAYRLMIDYFRQLKPKAGTQDGYWRLPEGDKAYALLLKLHTSTNYSPDFIHYTGLTEVARIQTEILTILASEGFDVSEGFSAAIEALKADPKFYYEDSDEGREKILADYQKILDQIDAGVGEVFNIRPDTGMKVRRIPQFKEKTAPAAYYQQPAIDGSRPGMFFANLYDVKATPTYSMRTLAYHEGIPGHHFQISIGMEVEGLPLFRRIPLATAYTEGWALYAERLAWELGFETDPYDNIGRLQAELFRAVRLVVDTGIHHKRWTRQQAIQYMLTNTGMAESDVIAEIERYIVMPGQATSYKVGMMKILELREKAKNTLGDKFDLKDFHDVVLKNGAVPLAILERLIDDYIVATQAI